MKQYEEIRGEELTRLCADVRQMVADGRFEESRDRICSAMVMYPNAPQPHNLLGLVMEKTGNHASAMRHFRAAWALDPTYSPASQNLTTYGTFYARGQAAFDEDDCCQEPGGCVVEYDSHGVGRIIRRK